MKRIHLNYMQQIERSAEANRSFSNFSGSVAAGTPGIINPLNRTITVIITNATNAAGTWVFGGFNVFGDSATAGNDTGITVTVPESSYSQVKRDAATTPFYIAGCKVSVTDVLQFNNIWYKNYQSSTGKFERYVIQPNNWRNPSNYQSNLLIADPSQFALTLDGMTYLSGTINAGVTMSISITLGARTDFGAVLEAKSPVAISTNPFPYAQNPIVIQQNAGASGSGSGGVASVVPMMQGSR